MALRKLHPGQILQGLPHENLNLPIDNKRRLDALIPPRPLNGAGHHQTLRSTSVINITGADIPARFPILAIEEPTLNPVDNGEQLFGRQIPLNGQIPTDSTSPTKIMVGTGPMVVGKAGHAVTSGVTWCRVNFSSLTHTRARPTNSTENLVSATEGLPILWPDPPDSMGEQWALVLVGESTGHNLIRGNAAANVTSSTPTFSINSALPYGELSVNLASSTVTVKNDGFEFDAGQTVWAAHRKDIGGPGIHWRVISGGGSGEGGTVPPSTHPTLIIAVPTSTGFDEQPASVATEYPSTHHDVSVLAENIVLSTSLMVTQLAEGYPYLAVLDTENTTVEVINYIAIQPKVVYGISVPQSVSAISTPATWNNLNDSFTPGALGFWPVSNNNHSIDRGGFILGALHYMTEADRVQEGGHLCAALGGRLVVFECEQIDGWGS